jgi:hypothetical protein
LPTSPPATSAGHSTCSETRVAFTSERTLDSHVILGKDVPYVRHPANAGAVEFADGMRVLLAFDFTRVGREAAAGSSRDRSLR